MTTKIITMTLLAVVSLILGFLPLKISKSVFIDDKKWKRTFTSVLLCFGGGVLFATSFIHMLPEVRLQQLFGQGRSSGKPYKYHISKEVGGWGQKMAIFADLFMLTQVGEWA